MLDAKRAESDHARTDALTGLASERSLHDILDTTLAEARTRGEPACVVMVGIDRFDQFADTWGQASSEQVLRLVASRIKSAISQRCTAIRFGRHAFVVVLPATETANAREIASQICQTVQARILVRRHTGESLGKITLSVGVAESAPGDTTITILARAETGLHLSQTKPTTRASA